MRLDDGTAIQEHLADGYTLLKLCRTQQETAGPEQAIRTLNQISLFSLDEGSPATHSLCDLCRQEQQQRVIVGAGAKLPEFSRSEIADGFGAGCVVAQAVWRERLRLQISTWSLER